MEAILFDLGDTLINFAGVNSKAIFSTAAEKTYGYLLGRGIELPSYERYFRLHYKTVMRHYLWSHVSRRDFDSGDLMRKVAIRLGVPTDAALLRELCWMWYEPARESGKVEPGLREMLSEFRGIGIKMGVVSNTFAPPHCLDRHLEEEGLMEFFPVRVYSSETRYKKPHRQIFYRAFERNGMAPEKTIFVGDLHQTDIIGATGVGMKTVWKPVSGRRRNPAKHRATVVIDKITDLAGVLPQLGFKLPELAEQR